MKLNSRWIKVTVLAYKNMPHFVEIWAQYVDGSAECLGDRNLDGGSHSTVVARKYLEGLPKYVLRNFDRRPVE